MIQSEGHQDGPLALAQVVPGGLPGGHGIAEHSQHIVPQLERLAQRQGEGRVAAQKILGGRVSSIENHFSIGHRDQRAEMEYAAAHGIAYLLWGPLGGLGGAARIAERHPALRQISLERGVSPQRIALAWELRQSPTVVPIPGAISAEQAADSAAAASFELSEEEIALLDADTGQDA